MDSLEKATENFKKLRFHCLEHTPYLAPINNPDEIKKLEEMLRNPRIDSKIRDLLEDNLRLQTHGVDEMLEAFQAFDSFRGLGWHSDERPYINGRFMSKDGKYELSFLARFPEVINDMNFFKVHFGINYFGDVPCSEGEGKNVIEAEKKFRGISDEVKIGCLSCKLVVPPYTLNIASEDLNSAYSHLIDAMGKLGYREGKITEPRSQQ